MIRPRPQDEDTICAVITPYGKGGVSVIRVSGPQALKTAQKICPFLPKNPSSHQAYFGFLNHEGKDVDEVVVLFFKKGRSFTGEFTVEISCHGNPVICEEILHILQELGCRSADRGEFTYRAFLSGRIDLAQAESVLSLIEAGSKKAKRQALHYLKGFFSKELTKIQNQIQKMLAHIEAEIDFSGENLETLSVEDCLKETMKIQKKIENLIGSYKQGVYVREGLKVGIFGPPNSGKSTLLNQFLGEERSIVSEQEGTTRDKIEEVFFIKDQQVRIADTAGLRRSREFIEKKGLEKTLQTLESCSICFYVLDGSKNFKDFFDFFEKNSLKNNFSSFQKDEELSCCEKFYKKFFLRFKKEKEDIVFIFNKTDLKSKAEILSDLKLNYPNEYKIFLNKNSFFISAQKGRGLDSLKQFLLEKTQSGETSVYLPRHYELFHQIQEHLRKTADLLKKKESSFELIAFELREVLERIQNILGQSADVDVLDQIFQQFCIGK